MKHLATSILLLLVMAGLASAQTMLFADSYDQALSQAGKENKKMLITFKTGW